MDSPPSYDDSNATTSNGKSSSQPLVKLSHIEQPMELTTVPSPATDMHVTPPQQPRQPQPHDGYGYSQPQGFPLQAQRQAQSPYSPNLNTGYQPPGVTASQQPRQPQPHDGYGYSQPQGFPLQAHSSNLNTGYQPPDTAMLQAADSYTVHIILACVVFWCCNWLFGLIAWGLALYADEKKFTNKIEARQLGKASLGVSISGIIVTVIIITIILAVHLGGHGIFNKSSYSSNSYPGQSYAGYTGYSSNSYPGQSGGYTSTSSCRFTTADGSCYRYRSYCYGSTRSCCGSYQVYSNGYCYNN